MHYEIRLDANIPAAVTVFVVFSQLLKYRLCGETEISVSRGFQDGTHQSREQSDSQALLTLL